MSELIEDKKYLESVLSEVRYEQQKGSEETPVMPLEVQEEALEFYIKDLNRRIQDAGSD